MTTRNTAIRAAVLKAIYDRVRQARTEAADAIMDVLDAGDRKHAVLEDGTDVGTITVSVGRAKAAVVDDKAFLDWVKASSPDDVVETVRESYRSYLLKVCAEEGAPVHRITGEEIPGVKVIHGAPYVTVRQTDEQRQAVVDAHAAGLLNEFLDDELRALPTGEGG